MHVLPELSNVNPWKDKFACHGDRMLYIQSNKIITFLLNFHRLVEVFNLDLTEQMYQISNDLFDRNNLKYCTIQNPTQEASVR